MATGVVCSVLAFLFSGCESWVDVTPEDRIVESTVFERQQGYEKLLNGLYSGLNSSSLYGLNMSAKLDVMGKIYKIDKYHHLAPIAQYNYGESEAKDFFSNIWEESYSLISNANTLIEHTEEADCPLSDRQKSRIKAEALAVRAFVHFDLLRLFGPVPSQLSSRAIPYQTSSNLDVQPFETGTQILTKIKADLTAARDFLQQSEPLLSQGDYTEEELASRPFRMNLYAVKAILARVYLYEGDKVNALKEATEVINSGTQYFPASTSSTDLLFQSEVLFSLYDTSRSTHIFSPLFAPTLGQYDFVTIAATSLGGGRLGEWYDDQNDYRYKLWSVEVEDGVEKLVFQKYTSIFSGYGNNMIPLVRMGEMYLIAAECANSLTEADRYLNTLRNRRNCFSIETDSETLRQYLTLEYRKELIGEGQMFFYYKRIEAEQMPVSEEESGSIDVDMASYQVPLPDSEISMREEFNK